MRLIRPDARDLRTLAAYNRCGFAAESADRLSEGCSASIEVGDYRDYTTYFFAALSGRHRSYQPLERSPDRDRDGYVTLHEAHVHARTTTPICRARPARPIWSASAAGLAALPRHHQRTRQRVWPACIRTGLAAEAAGAWHDAAARPRHSP